jgi:hypothetical protein
MPTRLPASGGKRNQNRYSADNNQASPLAKETKVNLFAHRKAREIH